MRGGPQRGNCDVCMQIAYGQREVIRQFDLKTRVCIGNTSMDPELSLIMSNVARVCSIYMYMYVTTRSA